MGLRELGQEGETQEEVQEEEMWEEEMWEEAMRAAGRGLTFAGADGLQHHLGGAALMQPGLLVQKFLLLHFLFLNTNPNRLCCGDQSAGSFLVTTF